MQGPDCLILVQVGELFGGKTVGFQIDVMWFEVKTPEHEVQTAGESPDHAQLFALVYQPFDERDEIAGEHGLMLS